MNDCKTCGHPKEDHKGIAMICLKQVGKNTNELCDCNWFDDGRVHVLPTTLEGFGKHENALHVTKNYFQEKEEPSSFN